MYIQNTLIPYRVLEHTGIQYSVCRDYGHISRYRGLRQVVHDYSGSDRFIALETCNPFVTSNTEVSYYEVPYHEENRLDLIAYKFLGDANYGWVIAYFNQIADGYTVKVGQLIAIPKYITSLFNKGEVLAPISPTTLNLGTE